MEVSRYNGKTRYNDDASKFAHTHPHALASNAVKCLRFPGNAVGKHFPNTILRC